MRWSTPLIKESFVGDLRVKSGFLFFPKTIENETRWLEYASWVEMYIKHGDETHDWILATWVDPE